MFKNTVTRPTTAKMVFGIEDGETVATIKGRKGRAIKCRVTETGRVAVPSECYYATLKKADGSSAVVKLVSDKTASVSMLAKLQLIEDEIAGGKRQRETTPTEPLAELVTRFHLERESAGISPGQIRSTKRFLRTALDSMKIESLADVRELQPGTVSKWVLGLPHAPHTKKHMASGFRSFLRWLHEQKMIPGVVRFPKIQGDTARPRRALTRAEVDRLAKVAPWPRNVLYSLAFATIARRGALLALTASDIGFAKTGAWMSLRSETSKTGVGQRVPIPKRLVPDLKRLIRERPTGELFAGVQVQLDGMDAFAVDLKKAGIPQINADGLAVFHCLRHGGTTALVRAGISLEIIRKLGGWKSLEMLSRHYAHIVPIDERALIDRVFE